MKYKRKRKPREGVDASAWGVSLRNSHRPLLACPHGAMYRAFASTAGFVSPWLMLVTKSAHQI